MRYREVYKLVSNTAFLYNTETHSTAPMDGYEPYQYEILNSCANLTTKPVELFSDKGSPFRVWRWTASTRFIGFDARELCPHTPLKDITLPLPFETERCGMRTFWATHEQAEIGHRLIVHRLDQGNQYMPDHRDTQLVNQIQPLLTQSGMPDIYELLGYYTLSECELPPRIYTPITMPASGYPSDIEQYITL